jgi:hypothetical protein
LHDEIARLKLEIQKTNQYQQTPMLLVAAHAKPEGLVTDSAKSTQATHARKLAIAGSRKDKEIKKCKEVKHKKPSTLPLAPVQATANGTLDQLLKTKTTKIHDPFGCKHVGLLSLIEMNRIQTKFYVQPGRFLDGTCCSDCRVGVDQLLPRPSGDVVLYHCNNDLKAFDLAAGKDKDYLACGTKVCVGCYAQRLEKLEGVDGDATRRSCRRRDSGN